MPAILFVGTWDGRKRGRLLHEVFLNHIRPALPDAELWMVADHCEPGPGVRMCGSPTDGELATLYRRAWVFCLPSSYEGLGLPYLEAMAHGTPIVATENIGAEYVLGRPPAGVIVPDANLAAALLALLTNEKDRFRLVCRGRERVQAFGWDRVVEAHLGVYQHAIARSKGRRAP